MQPDTMARWHKLVEARDVAALDDLLADEVVFQSPVVHTPQVGKAITRAYLTAAMRVLNTPAFHYLNEWRGPTSAVLEFATEIDGIQINGVDIIAWNAAGKITSFKVMVRPLKAINVLHQTMGRMLEAMAKKA